MAKKPLPNTLADVAMGSNKIYKARMRDSISPVNPRYLSKIGKITMIPPPGTAATEKRARTKKTVYIIYSMGVGRGMPKDVKIARAMMEIAKQSPIM